MSSGELFARVGQIELCYETFGEPTSAPLLLIMGLAGQMILWDEDFCQALADRGFWVIRFDNRDIGRSTILQGEPVPSRVQLLRRDPHAAVYSLDDMADDAAGLLDRLEVGAADVVGVSMGGMIAQLLAIRHPERVHSLVSIMSSTGNRRVGRTDVRLYPRLLRRPTSDRGGYVREFLATYRAIGSRRFPGDPQRQRALANRCFDRGVHRDGAARQLAAILAAPDRTERLRRLKLPATVIHGESDRLVMPSGGRATAAAIPGAQFVSIPGMGHDLPRELWPKIIDQLARTAGGAPASAGAAQN